MSLFMPFDIQRLFVPFPGAVREACFLSFLSQQQPDIQPLPSVVFSSLLSVEFASSVLRSLATCENYVFLGFSFPSALFQLRLTASRRATPLGPSKADPGIGGSSPPFDPYPRFLLTPNRLSPEFELPSFSSEPHFIFLLKPF